MNITPNRSRGFSLIEVMVALVVVAIGLLGLAKMESIAIASTSVAGSRSIAAMQAASLAATMHANRAYWASTVTTPAQTIVTNATASTVPTLCTSAGACTTPAAVAAYDLYNWSLSMNQTMPLYYASIDCTAIAVPVNWTITIKWTETGVAINAQQSNMAALALPTYQVYVEP